MKPTTLALLLLVSLAAFAAADYESEEEFEDDDKPSKSESRRHTLRTRIEEKSGRMYFAGWGANFNETVRVELKDIKEVQADGEDVDPKGADHEVDDFEDTTFVFTPEENSTYQGVAVKHLMFTASNLISSNDGSELTFEVLTFQENGIISVDGVDTPVQVGVVKFNLIINNWPWCNASDTTGGVSDCKGTQGEYLEVELKIESERDDDHEDSEGSEVKYAKEIDEEDEEGDRPRNRRFRLGATNSTLNEDPTMLGPELLLSSMVTVDGVLMNQTDNFPRSKFETDEQKFEFRFPRGKNIVYDPVLALSGINNSPAAAVGVSGLMVLASMLVAFFVRM